MYQVVYIPQVPGCMDAAVEHNQILSTEKETFIYIKDTQRYHAIKKKQVEFGLSEWIKLRLKLGFISLPRLTQDRQYWSTDLTWDTHEK